MSHNAAFYLGLHCLKTYKYRKVKPREPAHLDTIHLLESMDITGNYEKTVAAYWVILHSYLSSVNDFYQNQL